MSASLTRQNPFGAALPDCGVCAAYGVPWGSACARCSQSKGYPLPTVRQRDPRPLQAAIFARPAAAPAVARGPHPDPLVRAEIITPDDPRLPRLPGLKGRPSRPGQPAQIHATASKRDGWRLRLSYSRGNDLGSAGEPGPVIESVLLSAERIGTRFAALWVTSTAYTCPGCGKPLKPIQDGTFRKHGDCQGSGQRADGTPVALWEMACAYWQNGSLFEPRLARRPTYLGLMKLIKGAQ